MPSRHWLPTASKSRYWAPSMRFQGMAESIGPMWFKPKPKSKPNPGAGPTASRWSAPSPGKRTRREDHALLIVRDEFRTGYSSNGLLASRARLRFTGSPIIKQWTDRMEGFIIER